MKLKKVLAFVNNKGGVGKTTSVQNIASGILRKYPDARVLCIDMDPQGNLSDQLGWENTRRGLSPDASARTLAVALSRGLDGHLPVVRKADRWYYVPSCPQLEGIEPTLNASLKPKQMLGLLMGKPVDDISPWRSDAENDLPNGSKSGTIKLKNKSSAEETMFEAIEKAIAVHNPIIIHRHTNPDGDALGSCSARSTTEPHSPVASSRCCRRSMALSLCTAASATASASRKDRHSIATSSTMRPPAPPQSTMPPPSMN